MSLHAVVGDHGADVLNRDLPLARGKRKPTYVPASSCMSLATASDAPVTCIDWCDAHAYCAWAGKRLCGSIGGGPNIPSSVSIAGADQWYRACSHAGDHKFPYGDTYASGTCCT